MTTFDPGLFARSLMGGVAQGNSRREHDQELAIHLANLQKQEATEQASRQALLAQIDNLHPAPTPYLDLGPDEAAPNVAQQGMDAVRNSFAGTMGGQTPEVQAGLNQLQQGVPQAQPAQPTPTYNPQYLQYRQWRDSIQEAPSHVLQGIAGQFQGVDRAQRIYDYKQQMRDQAEQDAVNLLRTAEQKGYTEQHSARLSATKMALNEAGYDLPMLPNAIQPSDTEIDLARHKLHLPPRGHFTADQVQAVTPGMGPDDAAAAAATWNQAGRPVHIAAPPKAKLNVSAEDIHAGRPDLSPEQAQGFANLANETGKLQLPPARLKPGVAATREQAESRAEDVLRGAGIGANIQDPDQRTQAIRSSPLFQVLALNIEMNKGITDKETQAITGGDKSLTQRIQSHMAVSRLQDAGANLRQARTSADTWRRMFPKKTDSDMPAQLRNNLNSAAREYDDAHDAITKIGGEQQEAPKPAPQPSPQAGPPQGAAPPAPGPAPHPAVANIQQVLDALGIPPGQPLTPEQRAAVRQKIAELSGGNP